MTKVKEFAMFFGFQFISYALVCWNFRAISQAWYGSLVISDIAISINGYFLVKRIVEARSKTAICGYALGGACGSIFAVWLTRAVFGV